HDPNLGVLTDLDRAEQPVRTESFFTGKWHATGDLMICILPPLCPASNLPRIGRRNNRTLTHTVGRLSRAVTSALRDGSGEPSYILMSPEQPLVQRPDLGRHPLVAENIGEPPASFGSQPL